MKGHSLTPHRSTMKNSKKLQNSKKKSKKSQPSFSELPDNPDFALLRTINVRKILLLYSSHRLAMRPHASTI